MKLGTPRRQKHSRARDRTGNLLGPCCERDAMTIRPRDLIINIDNKMMDPRFLPYNVKEMLKISYQVAWPNGHGVSLTTRSEKVPGSIPGATMFLSPNMHSPTSILSLN
ncbi:hypothetical protein ACN42_g4848 [Penicillium freii]|uniref:Uncharacterized protein n=1 Tax=Penicillium freii TaxID=48697 RepID=A0A101MKL5_PENFR|nr:hypothetical protein ACN42_g4848 [Penicillium freii]